jgi:hypothetical protein
LLKLFIDPQGQRRVKLIGSGTYIAVGDVVGVLTAHHSAELLSGEYLLGLAAGREREEHNFTFDPSTISITEVGVPVSEEYGPDLAFIALADAEKIDQIKASKSFLDISQDSEAMLGDPPPVENSLWYACGAPHEKLRWDVSEAGFSDGTLEFMDLCMAGGIDRQFQRGDFDYIEIDISSPEGDIPSSFEGMSGGGLWQVPVGPSEDAAFAAVNHFLAGVIFYQGVDDSGMRFLRCHGPKSIYENVIGAIG